MAAQRNISKFIMTVATVCNAMVYDLSMQWFHNNGLISYVVDYMKMKWSEWN